MAEFCIAFIILGIAFAVLLAFFMVAIRIIGEQEYEMNRLKNEIYWRDRQMIDFRDKVHRLEDARRSFSIN